MQLRGLIFLILMIDTRVEVGCLRVIEVLVEELTILNIL